MATADGTVSGPPPKKPRFSMSSCIKSQEKRGRLPDLSELTQEVKTLPAPKQVHDKMKGPSRFVGIDVETHALVPRSTKEASFWRLGFLTAADEVLALGSARLGVLGGGSDEPVVKTCLVKPEKDVGHGEARHRERDRPQERPTIGRRSA